MILHSRPITNEEDVVAVRRQAREIAALLGFEPIDQTRIATAVSEIARNAFHYGRGGTAEFSVDSAANQYKIRICDQGPGILGIERILRGEYRSTSGMGLGIIGARRLMDDFAIESKPGHGTAITLVKDLPARADRSPVNLSRISAQLAGSFEPRVADELRQANRELLHLVPELLSRQDDLVRLNAELEDTNRGVVALYAELDEKAERLRRADEMKSRFLSHMSHEFRTPLTSIMALTRLLADEADGSLSPEQQKQVAFIRKSAENLLEMVNDLLDLARVEAGKTVVRPSRFAVASLFGGLRGVLRPLQVNEEVELIFEDPSGMPDLCTDEAKVSQILRNFVANALKFTERGEVRVSARLSDDGEVAIFSVRDTGIGVAAGDVDRIFEEFAQVDTPIHKKVKGTGLGLPLSKKLAELLGGRITVESTPGRGSTFSAEIPLAYPGAEAEPAPGGAVDVLVIDDEEIARYLIRQSLGCEMRYAEASNGRLGIELAKNQHPRAIILDISMPDMSGFEVLRQLRVDAVTRDIPVIVLTAKSLAREEVEDLCASANAVFSKELLSLADGGQRIRNALDAGCRSRAPVPPESRLRT